MKKLIFTILFIFTGISQAAELNYELLEPKFLPAIMVMEINKNNVLAHANYNELDFAERSKLALYELANHEVVTNTFVFKADGKIEYLGSKLVASGQRILFQQDYVSYKKVTLDNQEQKIGIMLRLEVELVTKKANLNLNGIFAIGAAASSGSAAGKLRLKVYGLSGKPVLDAIPAPSDVSEQSLLNAFTSIATIKSKIYEDDVYVLPQEIPELTFELGKK